MPFTDMNMPQIIMLGAVVAITIILLMRTSRYFARPKAPEPSWSSVGRRTKSDGEHAANVPQEMAAWEVEMHEFVREIKAELDSKMRALQAVITDADRAAARLEAALRGTPNASLPREGEALTEPNSMSKASLNAAARQEPRPPEIAKRSINFQEEAGKRQQGIDLSALPVSQAESLSPSGVPHAEHSSAQAKKEEIYTLADYGMTSAEIASRVGHPIGEVELILSLRGKDYL
jgi:hypothetical protein